MLIHSCLALAAFTAQESSSQGPRGVIPRVPEVIERPKLDGRLDEPFWDECLSITDFRQTLPIADAKPSHHTEVLLAFDRENLYIGLRCWDDEPDTIRATQMARDANLDPDDRVELLFDTFDDNRNGFWFQLGAAGSLGDALVSRNGTNFNKRWDAIWYGAAKITDEGWFGEIRIPFASINFDLDKSTWGFNARRFIRRHSEEVRWAAPDPRFRFFAPTHAGTLEGFGGMHHGLGLDVVPFFVGTYSNLDGQPEHWLGDAGLDVFYRLSPSTKLSLSFNTDFAETEVDSRRINLSRFALFFPEKRKFFLEDSGVFEFGRGDGDDPIPFFSRRIGLDREGNEVPLLANLKLTSTGDGYRFGLLDSQTKAAGENPERNLFVGRFAKNIYEQSSVGVIYTHGGPTSSPDDFTAGADLNLRTDTFMGDHSLRFSSYVLGTESRESSGDNLAYSAALEYPNDEIEASASYLTVERNFAPALGFVRRTDIRQYDANLAYRPRLNNTIRRLRFGLAPQWITNTSGETESRSLSITPIGFDFESGDELHLTVTPQEEILRQDFEIQDSFTIPAGTYDYVRYSASLETSDKREVSTQLSYTTGTFFDGERTDYDVSLDWRASKHALVGFEYGLNDVNIDAGSFDVNVVGMRLDLLLNTHTSWSNFVQWDDVSEDLGLNSRLRIIFEAGQDLFVVLNQGWTTYDGDLAPTSSDLRFKLSYTFRF